MEEAEEIVCGKIAHEKTTLIGWFLLAYIIASSIAQSLVINDS